jgi:hypothetical protein
MEPSLPPSPNSSNYNYALAKKSFKSISQGRLWFQWVNWSWLWAAAIVVLPGAAGFWGVAHLLRVPDPPDCRSEVLSADDASLRLYCAEIIAAQGTADDLLKAIRLVNGLSKDHPLRSEGDRLLAKWSQEVLRLGEERFQAGQLEEAIDLVKLIPINLLARQAANDQISRWESIWAKAEAIYSEAEAEKQQNHWQEAINQARGLWQVGNQYWANTKYQEFAREVQSVREADSWQKPNRPTRQSAPSNPDPVADLLAQWERERKAEDQAYLKKARELASSGALEDMRAAIAEANRVSFDGFHHDEAEQLIDTWTHQIESMEDRIYLDRAKELAGRDDINSLQAAIREAHWIFSDRPLFKEADNLIQQWNNRILELQAQLEPEQELIMEDEISTLEFNSETDEMPLNGERSPNPRLNLDVTPVLLSP